MSSRFLIALACVVVSSVVVVTGIHLAAREAVDLLSRGSIDAWRPSALTWCSLIAIVLAVRIAHAVRTERRRAGELGGE